MAPAKRKRNDRASVDSGENRPSPHRPGNTALGQHDREIDMRNGGGGRRPSRGGRGGGRAPRNERRNSSDNSNRTPAAQHTVPGPMSPPAPRPSSSTPQTQHQASTTTPSPAPIEDTPPPEIKRDPSIYAYTQITDHRVASWAATGRHEVVAAGLQALDDLDFSDLSSIFQELLRATLDRKLDPTDAGTCVKEILVAPENEILAKIDGNTLFLDTLSIMTDNEPYDPILQRLLSATGIPPNLMRQTLDAPLLQNLGLTRNTFIKAGIRQVTNILYRQANHNLLREETEGYSKLVTELFTTSGSEPPTGEVVEDTFERVKGLIGTFDLDVGRVLDVTLDIFAAVLIKQFRFFIKFLRVSSWWPRDTSLYDSSQFGYDCRGLPKWALPGSSSWTTTAEDEEASTEQREERDRAFWKRAREIGLDAFFELGGRHVIDEERKKSLIAGRAASDTRPDADLQWIETTGTIPPSGNRVAAQLLGFKLRFYASEAREMDDTLPSNLMYLTALLVKIGFISLRDIYPHLWPLDEDMPAVRDARMKDIAEKEKNSRPGAARNALMDAAPLADDTLPTASRSREAMTAKPDSTAVGAPTDTEEQTKEELPTPNDQKVQLLTNLLTIGALPESLFMLGRFPWLPEVYPDLYDLLHRILHYSINKVYEASQVEGIPANDCTGKKIADVDQGNALKGQVRRTETVPRKALRWPYPDKSDTNEGVNYRFYWDEWADNVPICQNVDDVFVLCRTLLNLSGVNIGRDSSLLSKFATIGTKSLSQDHSEANLGRWQDLLKRLLVPALSLTKSNASVVNEIYDMLRYFPCSTRFSIYAEWFGGAASRQPALIAAFSRTRLETISIMKRISTTNIASMARTLAKITYANPGIAFKVALGQIQSYSNLTEVVVECAKYFTDLGYDVLIWSLMSALGDKKRSHTRDDSALLTSRWLIALSKFAGKVFKRYSIMNPTPILQYVSDQLYRGNSTDLIILEELIGQMGGVVSDTDFTDSQLLAMTGGEILRRQTLIRLKDRRFESTKTARSLMRSLVDTKLAGELLISIAQHRQSAIYSVSDDEAHIKYLATMVDETQRILVQYLDLLRSNLSVEQFDALVPNTADLMAEFGLDPSLAFLIGRASYAHRLTVLQTPHLKDTSKEVPVANGLASQLDGDGDMAMELGTTLQATDKVEGSSLESGQSNGRPDDGLIGVSPPSSINSCLEALKPLFEAVQTILPGDTWQLVNPEFYVLFWQFSMKDINGSVAPYGLEQTRLIQEITELLNDKTDMSRSGMAKKEEARKALEKTKDDLFKESTQHYFKVRKLKAPLIAIKADCFRNLGGNEKSIANALLETCFIPRLLLSPIDTDYCFMLIKLLHKDGFPNFPILAIYTHLFHVNRLRSIIFACTIREAENFGRFLKQILGDLAAWHASKTVYELEAFGKFPERSGFAIKVSKDDKQSISLLEYEEFRKQLYGFHRSLQKALIDCLSGTEWMHIRNAITVLKGVIEHFPVIDFIGNRLESALREVAKREKNSREDLSLLANALIPNLVKRRSRYVIKQAFSEGVANTGEQQNGVKPSAVQPNTPEAAAFLKSDLKPTAPEFKPTSRAIPNGASTIKLVAGTDVEDGEVDDNKTLTAAQGADDEQDTKTSVPSAISLNSTLMPATSSAQDTSAPSAVEPTGPGDTLRVIADGNAQLTPSSRVEVGKTSSTTSVLEKPHTGLPSRPDVPFPSPMPSDRHLLSRQGDRRDTHQNRVDRLGDGMRDRPHDSLNFDRRPPEPLPRDMGRSGDRLSAAERDRDRHDSKRRGIEPFRDHRDSRDLRDYRDSGPLDNSRLHDLDSRLSRSDDTQVPRLTMTESNAGAAAIPDPPINPARAAQIFGTPEAPRSEPSRVARDEHRDRPSSRPHSPRRDRFHGTDRDHPDLRRNDRPANGRPPYAQEYPRARHDEPQPSMTGTRADWAGDRGPFDRSRDASVFQSTLPPSRSIDPDHGRLNQSSRSQADPNFGRLNPTPTSQIPSGPSRDRGNRNIGASRMPSASQPRYDSNSAPQELARPPTPDKQPPTGPAASRAPRRTGSGILEPPTSAPLSAPTTPASSSPTAGIHPERLRHIDTAATQQAVSNLAAQTLQQPAVPPSSTIPTGVHPSRLQAFQDDHSHTRQGLTLIQTTNINSLASRPPSPPIAGPPSGPKSHQNSSTSIMSPNGVAPPTGPSSASDRNQRTTLRQMQNLQNTINQAGHRGTTERMSDRGTNIRGRSSRSSLVGPTSDPLPPTVSSTPVSLPANGDGAGASSGDRSRDVNNSDRPLDLFPARSLNGAEGERDRDRERADARSGAGSRRESARPDRHSRRNSNSRSPVGDLERERERERVRERGAGLVDDGGRGEYRDRGSRGVTGTEARHSDRDLRRRDGEKFRDGRDTLHHPRNDLEWAGAGPGPDGGGPGRGGPRRDIRPGDNRRDFHSDGGARKRRSDEGGMGPDNRGHDKRPRR